MTTKAAEALAEPASSRPEAGLQHIASFPRMRCLAWHGDTLFVSRGYTVFASQVNRVSRRLSSWTRVGTFSPPWWRSQTSEYRLTYRLFRDGFHSLVVLPSGTIVAVVPKVIVTLTRGDEKFVTTHTIDRGTRPLHLAVTPAGKVYWGEYFDNPGRKEVHIYASDDDGQTWNVAYTFAAGSIRHIHNIVYDRWRDCVWILTGDEGDECRIIRGSRDLKDLQTVVQGTQQCRAVAIVPTADSVFFASDTPKEAKYIYRIGDDGSIRQQAQISSSAISGCQVGRAVFFSTMVEPGRVNSTSNSGLYASFDGDQWRSLARWQKDLWPMRLFQYGAVFLASGNNDTPLLAASSVALKPDLTLNLWRVHP